MQTNVEELKSYLVEGGYLTAEEFDAAAKTADESNRDLSDIFVEKGYFNEEYLAKALAGYFNAPFVDLESKQIDDATLHLLPESVARDSQAITFEQTADAVSLAMRNPGDLATIELVEKTTGKKVNPFIATDNGIRSALVRYQGRINTEFEEIIAGAVEQSSKLKGDVAEIARDVPIINIFDTIIKHAVSARAADIHVEPQENDVLIRYRVDGVLHEITRLPLFIHQAIIARIKILSSLRVDEHLSPQDGRFKFDIGETRVAIRVSILPTFHGEKAVLRLLEEGARFFTLEELGLTPEMATALNHEIAKPHGMILLTGPTGAGKSTTLYTILHLRNTPEVNISTIEDPIEYDSVGINQTQVNEQAGMTFAEGLRALLRQSPDIIMVGEIRDAETAQLAIHAALTGHLVLSTLHTNDAIGAIPRLVDMEVQRFLIASTLNVSMAQRLVRKICRDCIEPDASAEAKLEGLKRELKSSDPFLSDADFPNAFYHGKGCNTCSGSGYKGRIGLFELLALDDKMRTMISTDVPLDQVLKYARDKGMRSILQDGLNKVAQGVTTIEEIVKALEE